MLVSILIYFSVGFILDAIITQHQLKVTSGARLSASFLSFLITVISVLLIKNLINDDGIVLTCFYALGAAAGTFLAMSIRKKKKSEKNPGS